MRVKWVPTRPTGPLVSAPRIALTAACIPVVLFFAAVGLVQGEGRLALGASWLALLLAGVVAFPLGCWLRRDQAEPDVHLEDGATVIRYYAHEVSSLALLSVSAGGGLLLLAALARATDHTVVAAVLLPPAVLYLGFAVQVARRRIRRGSLRLSPTEVEHDGWCFRTRVSWSSAVVVSHAAAPALRFQVEAGHDPLVSRRCRFWRIDDPEPDGSITVPLDRLEADGRLVRQLVGLYSATPQLRRELGTPASLDRARLLDPSGHLTGGYPSG